MTDWLPDTWTEGAIAAGAALAVALLAAWWLSRRPPRRPRTIRVIYRSGAAQEFRCVSFSVSRTPSGEVAEVKWDNAWPMPMHIGIDDIAAVWQVR